MSGAPLALELKEVGVDYITATSHQSADSSSLVAFGRWLVSQEVSRGCADSSWRATGYHGRRAGHVAYGVSYQGAIVRASSYSAFEHWQQLLNVADNVTRLDIQVTAKPVAGTQATLSRHHRELLKAPRYRGKEAQFKMWYGPSGPEAAVIGRRVSDRFGRVYDKGLESQLPEYAGHLRYELELHRRLAFNTARHLDSQEFDQDAILTQVREFMRNRGLAVVDWCHKPRISPTTEQAISEASGRVIPEVTKALKWMTNSVQPAVKRLIESGHAEEVYAALGLLPPTKVGPVETSATWSQFDKWR